MTPSRSPAPSPHRFARAGLALFFLLAGAIAIAAPSACGGDDDPNPDFIGTTDASPPRLGAPEAGAAR